MTKRFVFPTSVRMIEERRLAKRAYKRGDDTVVEYESLGFFVVLEMLKTAIHISDTDPGIPIGAPARLIIEVDE